MAYDPTARGSLPCPASGSGHIQREITGSSCFLTSGTDWNPPDKLRRGQQLASTNLQASYAFKAAAKLVVNVASSVGAIGNGKGRVT